MRWSLTRLGPGAHGYSQRALGRIRKGQGWWEPNLRTFSS